VGSPKVTLANLTPFRPHLGSFSSGHTFKVLYIRALSPALAVKFNISPNRWQHFPLWPLFLQREKEKRTEMTGTQHVGTLKHEVLHFITIKMVLVIFHFQKNILFFAPLLFGSNIYRQQATTFSALA
jgi:hypothetical protein